MTRHRTVRKARAPRLLEKHVQKQVADFLRVIGGRVYELGHKRSMGRNCPHCGNFVPNNDFSTRQTPGLPDLFAFVPALRSREPQTPWYSLWWECKATGGRLSADQEGFGMYCGFADAWHGVGGLNEVIAFLLEKGVISEGQVNHQRLPAKKAAV